jgi:hypothetical protein
MNVFEKSRLIMPGTKNLPTSDPVSEIQRRMGTI